MINLNFYSNIIYSLRPEPQITKFCLRVDCLPEWFCVFEAELQAEVIDRVWIGLIRALISASAART